MGILKSEVGMRKLEYFEDGMRSGTSSAELKTEKNGGSEVKGFIRDLGIGDSEIGFGDCGHWRNKTEGF